MRRLVQAMICVSAIALAGVGPASAQKTAGALFTREMREKAKANAAANPWAREIQRALVEAAQPWMKLSDDQLWDLMFGATIKRSWMVWSNGYCPSCKKSVPMYTWVPDALNRPWTMQCPHCKELFPKNDFGKFYRSGLDEHGVFDPAKADRSLLFNREHPDPKDPLHMFGVDDGEGYVEGDHRWRFIGAYLIYGQWKQAIVQGIQNLATAYAVTGDTAYAHRAGVLLDRVADLYPTHDFGKQGVMYEGPPARGYVSTWHDACWEARTMALAYDQVFEALRDDVDLQKFLAGKSAQYKLDNPKASWADVQRNIEDRMLRDTLANSQKIVSNFPQTDLTLISIETVLGWPGNRTQILSKLGEITDKSTAVDGLTGEKGLSGYSRLSPSVLAQVLGQYSRIDPTFFPDMLKNHPRLYDCWRFHIDTWCLEKYYPTCGDAGGFGQPCPTYQGMILSKMPAASVAEPGLTPSMFQVLWDLYQATHDPAFVQLLYRGNDYKLDGLPHDIFADSPSQFQKAVNEVIDSNGTALKLRSVDKQQWHLAILRSGKGTDARCLWLDYDAGGGHSHQDGMNLGLYAHGIDLLPDFGYPPVQYGGWGSSRSQWYATTAAHDTVLVDRKNQKASSAITAGKTTLWADCDTFKCIRASGADIAAAKQYERTAAMVDVSAKDFYVIDLFRVVGGKEHANLLHSYFGKMTLQGAKPVACAPYIQRDEMRDFRIDPSPDAGWSAEWEIEDYYKLLPPASKLRLRCVDLTSGAQAMAAQKWICLGYSGNTEDWIDCIGTLRSSEQEPLASTFVRVLEPYMQRRFIKSIRRLPLRTEAGVEYPDANVALEVKLTNGCTDLFIAADVENPLGLFPSQAADRVLVQPDLKVRLDGEMCMVRFDRSGIPQKVFMGRAKSVSVRGRTFTSPDANGVRELAGDKR